MSINYKNILMSVFVFLAIFAPPIVKFNVIYILFGISALYLLKKSERKIVVRDSLFAALFFALSVYLIIVVLINELITPNIFIQNRIVVLYQFFILMPFQVVVAKFIWSINREEKALDWIIDLIIYACLIEGVLVLVAFLFPAARSFFLDVMVMNGGNARIYASEEYLAYRAYGFADTLLDTFGYGMGLTAGICILRNNKTYMSFISLLLCLFSSVLNSRTGILIFIIAIGIKLLWYMKNHRASFKIRYLFVVILLVAISYLAVDKELISTQSINWIIGGFSSVFNFITHKNTGYVLGSMKNSLFSKSFWELPPSIIERFFGTGHSCFGTYRINGYASDVGYVNYIWIIGYIGLGLLLVLLLHLFIKKYKQTNEEDKKYIIIFLMISFFVMFVKGNIITYSAGTFITILLMMGEEKKCQN